MVGCVLDPGRTALRRKLQLVDRATGRAQGNQYSRVAMHGGLSYPGPLGPAEAKWHHGAMSDTAPRYPRQVKYIVVSEACERFSFYGMSTILVPYMERALGWSEADASATYHYFVAAAYFMTLFGGWISDRLIGRYRTILWLSIGYVIGHATLALADVAPDLRIGALYVGMALIAIGAGGVKPNVSAFVGDQFRKEQRSLLDRIYSWFYFGINVGSASSQVATPALLAGLGALCCL